MKMARIEGGMRLVLAYHEAANRHDVPAMMALLSDDCRYEDSSPAPEGAVYTGKAAIAACWQTRFDRCPTFTDDIEEIFGLGLRCVVRWQRRCTETGAASAPMRGVDIYVIKGDLISEIRSYQKG